MAIVQTLDKYSFIDAFKQSSRKDQFSHEALDAIFDYLEEYSDSTGESVEFDMIGICCDWSEAHWSEIAEYYGVDLSDCSDDADRLKTIAEYLWDNTSAYELSDGNFVFVQF